MELGSDWNFLVGHATVWTCGHSKVKVFLYQLFIVYFLEKELEFLVHII